MYLQKSYVRYYKKSSTTILPFNRRENINKIILSKLFWYQYYIQPIQIFYSVAGIVKTVFNSAIRMIFYEKS